MAFVGVCIIFQAITSDIYVYNKKIDIESPTVIAPTPTTAIHASSIVPPWKQRNGFEENNPWIKKSLNNRWNFFLRKQCSTTNGKAGKLISHVTDRMQQYFTTIYSKCTCIRPITIAMPRSWLDFCLLDFDSNEQMLIVIFVSDFLYANSLMIHQTIAKEIITETEGLDTWSWIA